MIVFAEITQKVNIAPGDVIQKLIEEELGTDGWIFKEHDKYYRGFERSAGCHSFSDQKEITLKQYKYIQALQLILERLNKCSKQ